MIKLHFPMVRTLYFVQEELIITHRMKLQRHFIPVINARSKRVIRRRKGKISLTRELHLRICPPFYTHLLDD